MKKVLFYNFIVLFSFNFIHPITPELLLQKGTPEYLNAILLSAMSLGMFLFSPYIGELNQKYGPKFFIVTGPFLYGVVQIGFALFDSVLLLVLFRIVAGIFTAFFLVSMTVYVDMKTKREDKTKNFALLMVMMSLGGVFGQVFIGVIVSVTGNIFDAFTLQFVVTLLTGVLMYFTLDNPQITKSSSKSGSKDIIGLVSKNGLTYCYVVLMLVITAFIVYSSNIGYYAAQLLGFSIFEVSLLNSYTSLMVLFGNLFLTKYMEDRFGFYKTILLEVVFGIVAILLCLLTNNSIVIVLLLGLFIISISFIRPLVNKRISILDSPDIAILLGSANAVNSFAMMLGGIIASVSYTLHPNLPFAMVVVLLVIAFGVMLVKKDDF